MEPSERFNLRWDGFMANARVTFKELREKEEFCDVILVAGDGKQIHAHKVILSHGSSFLQRVLREHPHPHPLIYLKGMRSEHLVSLLDFIYTGEVNLVKEDLNEFMDIAEEMKVKGLTKNDSLVKTDEKQPKKCLSIQSHTVHQEAGLSHLYSAISPTSRSHPHSEISSSQDPVVAKKHGSSTRDSQQHGEKSLLEGPVEVDPLLKISYPERVMSERNDHSEEYIRDDSRRIINKTGGIVLAEEHKHNNQCGFTEEKIKEEAMSDNEQSVHDWYERGEEVMGSVLLSEQSSHNWGDNNMSDGEQDHNEKVLVLGKGKFQCSFCNKTFGKLSNLNRHKKIHTGEKSYQCLVCEKTFTQKSTLKSHERIHTGERPYQCSLCPKTFIQSSSLKKHLTMKNKCSI